MVKAESHGGVFSGKGPLESASGLFLVQVVVVIFLTRVLALVLRYVKQPSVIAEVIGGIILGPSLLGTYIPGFADTIFPQDSLPSLALMAELGLILYLFIVGLELDPKSMLSRINKTIVVAGLGIALPFAGGWAIAPLLEERIVRPSMKPGHHTDMVSFSVFISMSLSITAFPVLARIMNETKLLRTPVGAMGIGAAALDDVTAWSLLALSIALINASSPGVAAYIFLSVAAYAVVVLALFRPIWQAFVISVWETGSHSMQYTLLAATFLLIFTSAWITELLGVHSIFGAFLIGLSMPRGHEFTIAMAEKIEDVVSVVFLPLYFAASGLKTNINSLHGATAGLMLLLVLAVASFAKMVGCGVGAKLSGMTWRESVTVGILMNTRGLVELIVLNMGLQAGVINTELFTIMVLVALITTFLTTPLISWVYPKEMRKVDEDGRWVAETGAGKEAIRVMVVVDRMVEIPGITNMLFLFKQVAINAGAQLSIWAVQYIEASTASSDFVRIMQREPDDTPISPALNMIKVMGQLLGDTVATEPVIATSGQFVDHLVRRGSKADIILLPYKDKDREVIGDYHERFIAKAIKKTRTPLAVLVNSHLGKWSGTSLAPREILLIVGHGGDNDTEAVNIASQLKTIKTLELDVMIVRWKGVHTQALLRTHAMVATLKDVREMQEVEDKDAFIEVAKKGRYEFIILGSGNLPFDGPEGEEDGESGRNHSEPHTPHALATNRSEPPPTGLDRVQSGAPQHNHTHHQATITFFPYAHHIMPHAYTHRTRGKRTLYVHTKKITPEIRRSSMLGSAAGALIDVPIPLLVVHAPVEGHVATLRGSLSHLTPHHDAPHLAQAASEAPVIHRQMTMQDLVQEMNQRLDTEAKSSQ